MKRLVSVLRNEDATVYPKYSQMIFFCFFWEKRKRKKTDELTMCICRILLIYLGNNLKVWLRVQPNLS